MQDQYNEAWEHGWNSGLDFADAVIEDLTKRFDARVAEIRKNNNYWFLGSPRAERDAKWIESKAEALRAIQKVLKMNHKEEKKNAYYDAPQRVDTPPPDTAT